MNSKLTIEEMQELAKKKGGRCISIKYINAFTKLQWQCKESHTWMAAPAKIKNANRWCPYCRGGIRTETIADMQELAKKKDGKCLSKEYTNNHTKLQWQCREGHTWESISWNIKKGHWCPYCVGVGKRTIEEMQKLARTKEGKCLSKKYVSIHTKLKWQCKEGHIWDSEPASIHMGTWCSICSASISERVCRKTFELIFNERFPKLKPRWLINSRGNRMELDGYCKKLGIAFEYQGKQHYVFSRMLSINRNVKEQKQIDDLKKQLCKKHDLLLIEIPYTVDFEAMPNYIIRKCKAEGVQVPKITKSLDYRLMGIYSPDKIKGMQEIAERKGGKCLSKKYINSSTKLKWRCKEGHIWEATPRDVKYHTWCPYCARNVRLSIEEMQEIAEARGGKCLSAKYVNNEIKLNWECKEGHEWSARPADVKNGQWCPYCSHNIRLGIEKMHELAKSRGGICLSTKYINNRRKLKWQCDKRHVWEAVPCSVIKGCWCSVCSKIEVGKKRRLTIEEMQEFAKTKGGECISSEYKTAKENLKWKCVKGHVWVATPDRVKGRGQWCSVCAREKKERKLWTK